MLAYVLIPALSVISTGRFSRRVLRRVSHWRWFLAADVTYAFEGASLHLETGSEEHWKRRWKQVELLDVRDLYMMLFGRSRTVLAEIELPSNFEIVRDRVMVGMHWGPAISLLKWLAVSGLGPAFPFRPPEPELLRSRPFYYLFCRLAETYLTRTLSERAVPVGGASKVLQRMLSEPGSICVLMDAPPMAGRRALSRSILGSNAWFNTGFPALLADKRKEFVLYAMNLTSDGSLRKKLEIAGPYSADSAEELLDRFSGFLDRHLSMDSPQWRIWRAEHQFWREVAPGLEGDPE